MWTEHCHWVVKPGSAPIFISWWIPFKHVAEHLSTIRNTNQMLYVEAPWWGWVVSTLKCSGDNQQTTVLHSIKWRKHIIYIRAVEYQLHYKADEKALTKCVKWVDTSNVALKTCIGTLWICTDCSQYCFFWMFSFQDFIFYPSEQFCWDWCCISPQRPMWPRIPECISNSATPQDLL